MTTPTQQHRSGTNGMRKQRKRRTRRSTLLLAVLVAAVVLPTTTTASSVPAGSFPKRSSSGNAPSTCAGFVSSCSNRGLEGISYYARIALAGGLAGATGSAVLYPIDSAKTLRQSNPTAYKSVKDALLQMLRSSGIKRIYKGILPSALGAIPSSALYFGAYESSKVTLQKYFGSDNDDENVSSRMAIHALAAASGNVLSSTVFVPKEVVKQQLQIRAGKEGAAATIARILQTKGVRGLYVGYGATLLRNIPSATIRFVLYEEIKRRTSKDNKFGAFLAGAVAGSTASFAMTPIDVVKTRMATGSCPLGVKSCFLHVLKETGYKGLYAGAGSRVLWSGAFSAIGFGTFELVKGCLGVGVVVGDEATTTTIPKIKSDHFRDPVSILPRRRQ